MPAGAWARTGLVGAVAAGRVGVLGCALVAGGRVVLRADDGHGGVVPFWVAGGGRGSGGARLPAGLYFCPGPGGGGPGLYGAGGAAVPRGRSARPRGAVSVSRRFST